jgi:predicted Ser/Thr protein kinase
MQVPDNAAGKTVRCPNPNCKQMFAVPALSGAAAKPAAAPAAAPSKPVPAAAAAKAAPAPAPAPAKPAAPAAAATPSEPTVCPACSSPWTSGAIACMDCGILLQSETPAEVEGPPVLCPNQACGVANPPGATECMRCGDPLPKAAGTVLLGRYKLDKLLKMGGFGAVYKGMDQKNNREVAIKDMIGSDPQEFAIRLNFFRREAEILRSLDKVSIVPKVYDFAQEGQRAHLVMEFIRGKDLLDLMEENNNQPFAVPLVVEWAKSICDVLDHMHSQSPPLIHRDLKPDNIMLLDDKKSIKMIDFGTARDIGKTVKERMAGKTRVYTEGYAPPEQIVGKPEARSDLFALAATLYHLTTGKAPEGFYTAKELEDKLKDANSDIPAQNRWFFELIKINLAEDPNDRYFSAKEIKKDLNQQRVSKEVQCDKCKTNNPVRTPFCKKCAEPLTEAAAPCNACGKNNRMGSRFCIYCGNRIR